MLNGSELGDAIRLAMEMKGVKQKDVAEEFGISQPSVSEWLKFGRVDKRHINRLVAYFSDVASPEHWGLGDVVPDTGSTSEPGQDRYTSKTTTYKAVISFDSLHPGASLLLRLLSAASVPGVSVEVSKWTQDAPKKGLPGRAAGDAPAPTSVELGSLTLVPTKGKKEQAK